MPAERDPFELIRGNDSVDMTQLPSAQSKNADDLFDRITTTEPPGKSVRLSRRQRRLVLVIVLIAIAIATAAWIFLRDVTEPVGVLCYEDVTLQSSSILMSPDDTLDVTLCAVPWEQGVLINPSIPTGQVPPFTACVNNDGVLVVFPTNDPSTCSRLGLGGAEPELTDELSLVIQLETELVAYFSTTVCPSLLDAEARVVATISQIGLAEWTVKTQPPHPDRPCTSFGLDPDSRIILLVPIPLPPE